ncbi:hypothetical protein IT575_12055 [bacterium]|nr:hypothetical protein [bacterium]
MGRESYNERMLRSGRAVRDYKAEKARRVREQWHSCSRADSPEADGADARERAVLFWLAVAAAGLLFAAVLMASPASSAPEQQISGCCRCESEEKLQADAVARIEAYLELCQQRHELRQAQLLGRWIALGLRERSLTLGNSAGPGAEVQPGQRCQSLLPRERQCEPIVLAPYPAAGPDPPAAAVNFELRDFIASQTHARYPGLSLEECEAFADACVGFDDALWWCARGWAESSADTSAKGQRVYWHVKGRRLSGHCSGWWQIHPMHAPRMANLGLDYENEADRTEFARVLFADRGDRPWSESNGNARRFHSKLKRAWEAKVAGGSS